MYDSFFVQRPSREAKYDTLPPLNYGHACTFMNLTDLLCLKVQHTQC